MGWRSAEDGTEGRRLLEEKLTQLEAETPQCLFRTRDNYTLTIVNKGSTFIEAGLYHGYVFFFPIAGSIETIEYDKLRIKHPSISINNRSTKDEWDGLGTLREKYCDDHIYERGQNWRFRVIGGNFFTGEWTYGFFIDGINYRFTIVSREDDINSELDALNERMDLCKRISDTFQRLDHFRRNHKPKPRFLKPMYV